MLGEPTVFVVDDDLALLKSLRWLLESAQLRVETFASAQEFLAAFDPQKPGCLLLDVRMPGVSGVELQQILSERQAMIPTIFITGHGDVAMAVKCLNAGAFDFVEKPYDDVEFLKRIRAALKHDEQTRLETTKSIDAAVRIAQLTPRERQVMDSIVEGLANKQIGQKLGISEKTVAVHRSHMMSKLRADGVVDVIRIAMKSKAS